MIEWICFDELQMEESSMLLLPGNQMLSPQQFSTLGLGYKEGNLKKNATNGQVRMLSVFQRGKVVMNPQSGGMQEFQVCIECAVLLVASAVQRGEVWHGLCVSF